MADLGALALALASLVILATALAYRSPDRPDGQSPPGPASLAPGLPYHGPGCAYLHMGADLGAMLLGPPTALLGPWPGGRNPLISQGR